MPSKGACFFRIACIAADNEDWFVQLIMEEVKHSRAARFVDKLAVESEPGLTNAQLLLTNHDLKPVEPERRQWGAWNFVGFWIGTYARILDRDPCLLELGIYRADAHSPQPTRSTSTHG